MSRVKDSWPWPWPTWFLNGFSSSGLALAVSTRHHCPLLLMKANQWPLLTLWPSWATTALQAFPGSIVQRSMSAIGFRIFLPFSPEFLLTAIIETFPTTTWRRPSRVKHPRAGHLTVSHSGAEPPDIRVATEQIFTNLFFRGKALLCTYIVLSKFLPFQVQLDCKWDDNLNVSNIIYQSYKVGAIYAQD